MTRIIDTHNHPDWHGHDLKAMLANMDAHGIAKTWLLTWEAPADECDPSYTASTPGWSEAGPLPFTSALAYAQQAPDRFVLGYAPDPRRPAALDRLRGAVEIHGVRVYGELKLRMMYDNPDAIEIYRFCGEHGLPVVVHLDYAYDRSSRYPRPNYWYGGGIATFERAVAACPETVFLGHGPGFWAHISDDSRYLKEPYPQGPVVPDGALVRMLESYPNLCCDLSAGSALNALSRDREYSRALLTRFADRFTFARDCFDGRMAAHIESLGLPDDVREAVFHGNAERLVPDAS